MMSVTLYGWMDGWITLKEACRLHRRVSTVRSIVWVRGMKDKLGYTVPCWLCPYLSLLLSTHPFKDLWRRSV